MDELINNLDILIQAPVFFMALYLIYTSQKSNKEMIENMNNTFKQIIDNQTKIFEKLIDKK